MSLPRKDVESALQKKGFVLQDGGDHRYYKLVVDGKETAIFTKVSMGTQHKDLGDPLCSAMAKQIKLGNPQFRNFVGCSLSHDAYLEILREAGILPR